MYVSDIWMPILDNILNFKDNAFLGGDCMNEGDVLICIDPKDEHYLQIGYVNLIDIEGFETNIAYVEYQDKSTVKYEVWRMEGCFRRFITEGLRI
jgi:hypothetical protein